MSNFQSALPAQIKWSVGDNKYNEDGKNPKSLSLFVPVESINALANHLQALANDSEKLKTAKIWDYDASAEKEVKGVYLNAKGRDGRDGGSFGNINPAMAQSNAATQASSTESLPF